MTHPNKNWYLGFIFLLVATFFPVSRAEAFSIFNPLSAFSQVADTVSQRVSDIFYYLVMQKKYIFNNFEDPNVYVALPEEKDLTEATKVLISSSTDVVATPTTKPSTPKPSGNPILVKPPSIPKLEPTKPAPPEPSKNVATSVPGLVIDTENITIPEPKVEDKDYNINDLNYNNSPILIYTNKERAASSLPPLASNQLLDLIAKLRVDDLFDKQYFEHESPSGQSADDLAQDNDYEYLLIGENLAMGNFDGDQGIVSAWMDSPGHRANILNGRYKELGVAKREGLFNDRTVTIAVQIFGEPAATCTKPNPKTKVLIESSTESITQMQSQAKVIFDSLNSIKNDPQIDSSYYYQKVQEYNYFAKNINDAVLGLKNMVELYNSQVNEYNNCISL